MSHSLDGTWGNSYGSTMDLLCIDNQIYGMYRSHTGSTGVYLLVGNASDQPPTQQKGQSVSFSIFWRNIEGDDYDESWHWSGSMSGQLLSNRQMTLENCIVVSVPLDQYQQGNYIDELVFTQQSASHRVDIKQYFSKSIVEPIQSQPLSGIWENTSTSLTLEQTDAASGLTLGTLSQGKDTISLLGFIDTYVDSWMAQSFSFSGYNAKTQETVTLCGSLDYEQSHLMVYEWISQPTSFYANENILPVAD
ncbi:avidin/streptavidin family protein [Vibrio viridaestus]|uniref:Uncharacterized protein n=1 Tax=Vibrio viridaestus TaxID=2487322 RepID=A0A3N9TBK5_9VIBR|nr:avidin/streptavidin family protein [Vibrio viridaestus]RQW61083.1 hypothetical protein EES38_21275 [Vibrio viridaestus]